MGLERLIVILILQFLFGELVGGFCPFLTLKIRLLYRQKIVETLALFRIAN
jgi:hypothetical protein